MKNRRVVYRQFGDADVLELETVDCSTPKPGHVIVKMAGAGINPIDFKTRRGLGFVAAQMAEGVPWCPGYDLSGEVVDVGESVSQWQQGDRVYGMVGFPLVAGAYAEYVEAEAESLCKAPNTIELSAAAGIPLAALTAWQALFEAGNLQPNTRVLIHAAAGGVGHFAVQFAKAKGCHIIATASENNHEFLRSLGVDQAIDYRHQDFTKTCSGIDFVLDNIGGDVGIMSLSVLNSGAQLVTVPTITAQQIVDAALDKDVFVSGLTVKVNTAQLDKITMMLDDGQVSISINHAYSLENVKDAHIFMEKGHTQGKLILVP